MSNRKTNYCEIL